MDQEILQETIKKVKESSKKNFTQKIDLIVNLKSINLKNPEQNIDLFIPLKYQTGKNIKICALVNRELAEKAELFDKVIKKDDFPNINKKELKKYISEYDFFIAQGSLMTDVAKYFGKTLGPKGKMPNPKSGAIFDTSTDLNKLKDNLKRTVRLKTKNEPIIKTYVGNQNMKDEEILDNINAVYNALIHSLPQEEGNVRNIILKLTMGPVFKISLGKKK